MYSNCRCCQHSDDVVTLHIHIWVIFEIILQEELDQLNQKIAALENDLVNNHETINQLRKAVKALSNGDLTFKLPQLRPIEAMGQKMEAPVQKEVVPVHQPVKVDSQLAKPGWKPLPQLAAAQAEISNDECAFATVPNGNNVDVQVCDISWLVARGHVGVFPILK